MISTLLAVTSIVIAFHGLIRSTSSLYTARRRARAAASGFKGIVDSPERDIESPVIFLGPEIQTADLTDESPVAHNDDALDANNSDVQAASEGRFDETATWTRIIQECRRMERDSQDWEKLSWRVHHEMNPPDIQGNAVLTVRTQRTSGKQPSGNGTKLTQTTFAITSMRHLIELTAFFGLHWISFDSHKRYHAAGNGLALSGTKEKGIGFVIQFQRTGPGLSAKRVIPALEIRELCFGVIPTIYRTVDLTDTYTVPFDTPTTLETLRLGSRDKIAKTLLTIGCNRRSISAYIEGKESMLLFPVVFEMIGMLARTLHIKDRCFTYIPNPTSFRLNQEAFSLQRLLKSFHSLILEEEAQLLRAEGQSSHELCRISRIASRLDKELPHYQSRSLEPMAQNELHLALDELDISLKQYCKSLVLDVLRCHFEEILRANVQLGVESAKEQDLFSDLAFASRDTLEREIMKRYFRVIRLRVVAREPGNSKVSSVAIERNALWCTLVLRMICWLSLHNFHEDDSLILDYDLDRSNNLVYVTALPDVTGL